jgi:hypothetical protein
MPILNTERNFKKIILPSSTATDEAWVEVWDKVFTSDVIALSSYGGDKNKASIEIITSIIKDWNFTDSEGNKLPITSENVNFMSILDVAKIIEETTAFRQIEAMSLVKKKS